MTHNHTRTILVATGDDHPVRVDLYLPPRPAGICILCPGFKGYKSWGFFPFLAGHLYEAGYAAVTVDFSHNGTIPADGTESRKASDRYCEPFLFSKNTISREYGDLAALLGHLRDDGFAGAIDGDLPVALFGHSRAGIAVLLNALEFPQVKAIASWGMPAHPNIFSEEQKRKWRETGAIEFTETATRSNLRVSSEYLRDMEEHHERFDMVDAVTRLNTPHLIVNGTADVPVPPSAAIRLFNASNRQNPTRLLLVRSGHTFGAASTVTNPTVALRRAVEVTVEWFGNHVGNSGKGDR